jgi:hypothetical protein
MRHQLFDRFKESLNLEFIWLFDVEKVSMTLFLAPYVSERKLEVPSTKANEI